MYLKRYRMPTVKEALAAARSELGPHALVLSTRLVSRRGVAGWLGAREVELTAALDRPVSENRPSEPQARQAGPRAASGDQIVARLSAIGLDKALAQEVADALPWSERRGASIASLRRALSGRLAPLVASDEGFAPVELFVGPPGAGKTTTVAKIAAQQRARHGRRLPLVSADAHRVGAAEQLRIYADVIGSPFVAARTTADLERALAALPSPVLVDTAGVSAADRSTRELFAWLADRPAVRTHLVLPASTSARDLPRVASLLESHRPSRVALTRLDEAESIGPLVGALRQWQIPISFMSTGQRVPEDLERATPDRLAASVLGDLACHAGGLR